MPFCITCKKMEGVVEDLPKQQLCLLNLLAVPLRVQVILTGHRPDTAGQVSGGGGNVLYQRFGLDLNS